MTDTRKILRVLGIIILIVILIYTGKRVRQVSRSDIFRNMKSSEQNQPDMVISNFSIDKTAENEREWQLSADTGQVFQDDVLMDNINMVIFQDNSSTVTILSNEGQVNSKTRNVILEGDVRAHSTEGIKLSTESLRWNSAESLLYTDKPVRIIRGSSLLSARNGIQAKSGLEYAILKDVSGKIVFQKKNR